jgi:hypothetical protein
MATQHKPRTLRFPQSTQGSPAYDDQQANEIDSAYEKQYSQFNTQHDFLKTVFGGSPLGDDLNKLMDNVSDASWLNVKAGGLSDTFHKFDPLEYFVAQIKLDYRGAVRKEPRRCAR